MAGRSAPNPVPQWFAHEWAGWFVRVVWAGRLARQEGWDRSSIPRDYWTYVGVDKGRLALRQGTWSQTLGPGEQTVLAPSRSTRWSTSASEGAEIVILDFRMVPGPIGVDPLPKLGLPAKVAARDLAAWRRTCRVLFGMECVGRRGGAHDVLQVRPLADLLLSTYVTDGFAAGAFAASESDAVPEWLARLRDRMGEPGAWMALSMKDLMKISGFSRSHVSHEFRRRFGRPPMQYLMGLRLRVAARKLSSERSLAIEDVAASLGFKSPSRFSQAFRDLFGVTPSQWRRGQHGETS